MSSESTRQGIIGDYTVLGEISRGSMGIVHRGERGGKPCAIKFLKVPDFDNINRFRKEAASAARLNDPCLVSVLDFRENDGNPFLVMELLDGDTLEKALTAGPLAKERVVAVARAVASALGEVHRYNLVHRDIKPANIMLTSDGRVKLFDLGLIGDAADMAGGGDQSVVGTLRYSSPEQCKMLKRPVDGRSDLYSLGIVLFEALSGMPPFLGEDIATLMKMHAAVAAPSLLERVSGVSPVLAGVVAKLLEKDPDDRYQSAQGLAFDIERMGALEAEARQSGKIRLGSRDLLAGGSEQQALAGRAREMERLTSVWNGVLQKRGRALVIEGEGGSGKSRLTQELLRMASLQENRLILRAKCEPLSKEVPLASFREAFDQLLSRVRSMPEEDKGRWITLLTEAVGPFSSAALQLSSGFKDFLGASRERATFDLEGERQRFFDDLAELLVRLSRNFAGTILVIDDIQWMDKASCTVLQKLSERLADAPLLVLMTSRNDSESISSLNLLKDAMGASLEESIVTGPLDSEAVKEIVASRLGQGSLDPLAIEKIARAAHGNPFVIGELLRSLLESGSLRFMDGGWNISIEGISSLALSQDAFGLVSARIQGMGPVVKNCLVIAATIGNQFNLEEVAAVARILYETDIDQIVSAVQAAAAGDLVSAVEGSRFRFVHDRIRETMVLELSEEKAREINDRLADFLDGSDSTRAGDKPWADLARYYARGTPGRNPASASRAAAQAGKIAISNYLFVQAHELLAFAYRSALEAGFAGTELKRIARDFSFASSQSGYERDAHLAIDRALSLATDLNERVEFLYLKIMAYVSAGSQNEAWVIFKDLAELTGNPIPRYAIGKLLEINGLALKVGLKVLSGWGFGSVAPDSEKRKYVENLSTAYYFTAYFVNRFRLNFSDTLIMYLRTADIAFPLGRSAALARAMAHIGWILASYQLRDLATWCMDFSKSLVDEASDPATVTYLNLMEMYYLTLWGDPKWAEKETQLKPRVEKYLGPFERLIFISTGAVVRSIRGFYREAVEHILSELAFVQSAKYYVHEAVFYNQLAVNLTPLGKVAEAAEYRKVQTRLIDKEVKDVRWAIGSYPLGSMTSDLEQAEISSDTDFTIDYFYSLRFNESSNKSVYIAIVYIRLFQYERSVGEEERKRARRLLKTALRTLYLKAFTGLYQCHWWIAKAAIERLEGNQAEALRLVEKGHALALASDTPNGIFQAAVERAKIRRAMGDLFLTRVEGTVALALAIESGWEGRARAVEREFGVRWGFTNAGLAADVTTHGQSRSASGRSRESDARANRTMYRTVIAGASRKGSTVNSTAGSTRVKTDAITKTERAMQAMIQVSLASTASADPVEQAKAVLDELVKLFGANRAFLFMRPESETPVVHGAASLPPPKADLPAS